MYRCHNCGKTTSAGQYDYTGKFTCVTCAPLLNTLHFDTFEINEDGVVRNTPLADKTEEEQRQAVIAFAYNIFNNKLNPAAYRLINQYLKKGYTYLGILRALEYFYVVKKNGIAKSKNNIGIVPYVYNDAQDYYQYKNQQAYKHYLNNFKASKEEVEERVVSIQEEKKVKHIDMTDL